MVISIETQKEMYRYLLSDKKTNIRNIDSNIQEFLRLTIKELAKKLYLRTELYIGKIQLQLDENNKVVRKKNYKCASNDATGDLQKIDVGIALCHFMLELKEQGKDSEIMERNPQIEIPDDSEYIISVKVQ